MEIPALPERKIALYEEKRDGMDSNLVQHNKNK